MMMIHALAGSVAVAASILMIPFSARAGELAKLALKDQPVALLGGRLSVKMPKDAKVQARAHSIMAAAESNEDETRVMLDAGKERLVLMAYEMYALAGGDLEKAARADVANSWGKDASAVKFEKLAAAAPLQAVVLVPPASDGKGEANLVLGLYVRSADDTVQFLAFYVNPEGAKDTAGATALARKIAATVGAGTRLLSSKAGEFRFAGVGAGRLVVTVPDGFAAATQEGPDFSVYRLRKLSLLGQPVSSCGIYIGGHPSYQHQQADNPPDKVTPIKGKLFGTGVEWQNWTKAGRITAEAIVPHPKGQGMMVHVFCSAASEDELKALRAVAETLRVEEPKK